MNKLSRIALIGFSCAALILTKPLSSSAFTPSDLDASNDALNSLAVPLKMLRFDLQNTSRGLASENIIDTSDTFSASLPSTTNLYVVNSVGAIFSRYDPATGTLLQTNVLSAGPRSVTIGGQNQDVFVSTIGSATQVLRYDRSGNFLSTFAADQGGAALSNPGALKFGSNNGNLFVANAGTASISGFISQFDKDTGGFLGVFASNGSSFRPSGIAFGADSNLYVGDNASKTVLRFNGTTGALLGTFASNSNLLNPGDLAFGPNGNLFVGNTTGNLTGNILQFNGTTGAFINTFTSGTTLGNPSSFAFGPDNNLYVTDSLNLRIAEFDGTTGAFIKNFATNSSSNDLIDPVGLVFGPAPVPEPAMGVGLPSLLLLGAYFKSKKHRNASGKQESSSLE
jgi:sugar lactone lactonase YvrE